MSSSSTTSASAAVHSLPPTVALAHFCEQDGPQTVFVTQFLHVAAGVVAANAAAPGESTGDDDGIYRLPPSFLRDLRNSSSKGGGSKQQEHMGRSVTGSGAPHHAHPHPHAPAHHHRDDSTHSFSTGNEGSGEASRQRPAPSSGNTLRSPPSTLDGFAMSLSSRLAEGGFSYTFSPPASPMVKRQRAIALSPTQHHLQRSFPSPNKSASAGSGAPLAAGAGQSWESRSSISASTSTSHLVARSARFPSKEQVDGSLIAASRSAEFTAKGITSSAVNVSIHVSPDANNSAVSIVSALMEEDDEGDEEKEIAPTIAAKITPRALFPANDDVEDGREADREKKPVPADTGDEPRAVLLKSSEIAKNSVLAGVEGRKRRSPSVSNVNIHLRHKVPAGAEPITLATAARCPACESLAPGKGLFSIDTSSKQHADGIDADVRTDTSFFVTTAKPPPASYAHVRSATLRVLSSEVAPGGRGTVLLSINPDGEHAKPGQKPVWLFSYMFSLKDAYHRGQNRRYAFLVLLPSEHIKAGHSDRRQRPELHSHVLIRCSDFVSRFFSRLVDDMQEICNRRYESEKHVPVQPQLRSARTSAPGGAPNRFAAAAYKVRPLVDLLNDPEFWINLHYRFCWLLRSLAESLYVLDLSPHWLPITTAASTTRATSDRLSDLSDSVTAITLARIADWLGVRETRSVLHQLLTGNQVVLRIFADSVPADHLHRGALSLLVNSIARVFQVLRKLVPFSSILVTQCMWPKRYMMPFEGTLVAMVVADTVGQFSPAAGVEITPASKAEVPVDDLCDRDAGIAVAVIDVRYASSGQAGTATAGSNEIDVAFSQWKATLSSLNQCERALRGSHCQLQDDYIRIIKLALPHIRESNALAFAKEAWKTKARQYARTLLACESAGDPRLTAVKHAWRLNNADELALSYWAGAVRRAEHQNRPE